MFDAAIANPDIDFGVIDIAYDPPLDNVEAFVWREDQSGFLAGVVAGDVLGAPESPAACRQRCRCAPWPCRLRC